MLISPKIFLKLLILFLILITLNCSSKSPTGSENGDSNIFEQTGKIGESGGKIQITDKNSPIYGSYIDIPKGALKSQTTISINTVKETYYFEEDSNNICISLEPSGIIFEMPVTIAIPYKDGVNTNNLNVYNFNEEKSIWEQLPLIRIDTENNVAIAQTNHFTVFVVKDSHVRFDVTPYKNGEKICASVKLVTPLEDMPTDLATLIATGAKNIKQLIKQQPFGVKAKFEVTLKEKKDFWLDPEIESKVIMYGIHSSDVSSYEVRATNGNGNTIFETNGKYLNLDKVEDYYSAEPILFQFDANIESNKEYYFEVILYYVDYWGWIFSSGGFWGTQGYCVSTFDFSKTFSSMTNAPDQDGDGIINQYDETTGNIPQVEITSPDNGSSYTAGESINFSGSATDQEDGNLADNSLIWTSDRDGQIGIGVSLTYSNLSINNHKIKLTATDNDNNQTSDEISITINSIPNTNPTASFTVNPSSGNTSTIFNFDGSGSTDNEDATSALQVRWDWENNGSWDTGYSTTKTATHQYSTEGTKTIKMEVKDSGGLTNSTTRQTTVTSGNTQPTASFTVNPTSGTTSTMFNFDGSGSSDNEDPASSLEVRWDWENDGSWDTGYSTTKTATHQYSTEGTKTIKMEVKDSGGLTNSTTRQTTVTSGNNTQPTASFTVNPSSGTTLTTFNFDGSGSSDNEDPASSLEIRWDWENDGSWDTGYSTTKTATHQYSTEGTKNIKLEVKDTGGLTNSTINQISVTNSGGETGTVTDIDGNVYQTIKIGNQWWMAENLKVTHYRNGDAIPNVTDNTEWGGGSTGAMCSYDNDDNNIETYGLLYNWYAVDDSRNIAPAGWHVPSDGEWQVLVDYLGGASVAGGKMKETGTTHWYFPNTGATNESGFTALPGGYRNDYGSFYSIGYEADYCSATEYNSNYAWYRYLFYNDSDIRPDYVDKHSGFSVRLVRD